jgi:hypothetical protein
MILSPSTVLGSVKSAFMSEHWLSVSAHGKENGKEKVKFW